MGKLLAFGTALALAFSLMLAGCGETEVPDVAGRAGDDAKSALHSAGFYTIDLVQEDGSPAYVGSLYTVVSQEPQAGTMAPASEKITLTVRNEAKIEREAQAQAASEARAAMQEYVGGRAADAYARLTEQGYAVKLLDDGGDCTRMITEGAEDPDNPLTVTLIGTVDVDDGKVTLFVDDEASIEQRAADADARAALEEKLTLTSAWTAVQRCGYESYPEGFDVHYIVGSLAEDVLDENTWYLKANCDVTTEYGEELEAICEATVTASEEGPRVTSFLVYGKGGWF